MHSLNLLKYNRHWESGFRYPFPKHRECFGEFAVSLDKRQIVELVGLRRVGKTTMLFQLINKLLNEGIEPYSLWYFTFDEDRPGLEVLLNEFSKQTGRDIKSGKVYIFLDEVQKLNDFQSQLKIYYDLYPGLKFFVSGSTSLFIRKRSRESLAGRTISHYLAPLSFKEYLHFKGMDELSKKPKMFGSQIEREFESFLTCQLIETISMQNNEEKKEYLGSIIKKIIYEDIPQILPVEDPEQLWRIVRFIAQHPGALTDFLSLADEMGISNKTASRYLSYLEEAFLVKKLYNFSRSMTTSERKLKRFYLASPSFSWALVDFANKGALVENFMASIKSFKFFWRDPYKHEVDFIDVEGNDVIPIEVKYTDNIRTKYLKGISLFCSRFSVTKAVILTKTSQPQSFQYGPVTIEERPVFFETASFRAG